MKKDKQKIKEIKRAMQTGIFPIQFRAAVKAVNTSLKQVQKQLSSEYDRDVIQSITSRQKTPSSIYTKLVKKDLEISFASAQRSIKDLIGVRAVCVFHDDIYAVAALLKAQNHLTLIKEKDYIQNPKKNGYRSLHLVFDVPILVKGVNYCVPVELQLCSMAMDYWSVAEHQFVYKKKLPQAEAISKQLKQYARELNKIDCKMQKLRDELTRQQILETQVSSYLVTAER